MKILDNIKNFFVLMAKVLDYIQILIGGIILLAIISVIFFREELIMLIIALFVKFTGIY